MPVKNKVVCWNSEGRFWNWVARCWTGRPLPMDASVFLIERPLIEKSGVEFDSCFVDPNERDLYNKVIERCKTGELGWVITDD